MICCPTPALGSEASPLRTSRRRFLLGAAGVGLIGTLPFASWGQTLPLVRRGTPTIALGPFYPLDRPPEEDADLTRIAGRDGRAKGVLMELSGRVMDETRRPVAGAILDLWQTNGFGRYHHPADTSDRPLDPCFQGAAVLRTDVEGRYWLRTVMPLPYEQRQPHLHFDIRGKRRRLITQMLFPGEPNDRDPLFAALATPAMREAVVANDAGTRDGTRLFTWDIVLAGE